MGNQDAGKVAAGGSPSEGRETGENERIEGGYCLIPVWEIAAVWLLLRSGRLRTLDVRVYLACHEAISRRCTVPKGTPSRFTLSEILALTGGTEPRLKAALGRLEAAGVLTFCESEIRFEKDLGKLALDPRAFEEFLARFPNNKRLLPVPRRMLRLLAGGARLSLIATVLGHLLWGLYRAIPRGGTPATFSSTGRVKCSWIADTFGIDLRRVKAARRELIDLGWLIPQDSEQWQLNRYGAAFRIDLAWERSGQGRGAAPQKAPAEQVSETKLPPPSADFGPKLPPPESDKKLPNGTYKNQEPASGGPAGVQTQKSEEGKAGEAKPTLRNVVPQDLRDAGRLLELHAQAVDAGLISSSESDRLKFVSAAEHARVIGTVNPCGLFVRLVRSKLWHYLTQDDEDAANRKLKAVLYAPRQGPAETLTVPVLKKPQAPALSEDALLVQAVRAAAQRAGYRGDAFPLLRREKPEWTRERWDQAVTELERRVTRGTAMTSVGDVLGPKENL